MASKALRQVVNRIFTSERTKAKFMADPKSVFSQFRLTRDEKRAVLTMHARLGLVNGDSSVLQDDIGPTIWWV